MIPAREPTITVVFVAILVALGADRLTVTVMVKRPGVRYRCRPMTAKLPFCPLIVPRPTRPSPHRMIAVKRSAEVEVLASTNVATVPTNALWVVAVMTDDCEDRTSGWGPAAIGPGFD